MNKQEFLNSLRASLGSELPVSRVEEHVRYYEEYISSELRMGKKEETILQSLGNPKLIARSIIDAEKNAFGTGNGNFAGDDKNYEYGTETGNRGCVRKVRKLPVWAIVLLIVVFVFVILSALVMFVWWLAPIIIIVWLAVFFVKVISGKK